jgi:hypothetical protein
MIIGCDTSAHLACLYSGGAACLNLTAPSVVDFCTAYEEHRPEYHTTSPAVG